MKMTKLFMSAVLMLLVATVAFAQSTPVAVQDPNGSLVVSSSDGTDANIYKYDGSPRSFDARLDIHGISATAKKMSDGKYTMAFYADPNGGAIFCGDQDGGLMTEDMRMKRYAPSEGYRYEYSLGNLIGPQRKKMPKGTIDQANKRVIFEGVELKPGQKNVRVNLVVKIFGPDGQEIKAPDPDGFYGWTTDDPDKSVVGIKDNGWLFDVLLDGTIQGKGEDHRPKS